jgi:hypothetical protein
MAKPTERAKDPVRIAKVAAVEESALTQPGV